MRAEGDVVVDRERRLWLCWLGCGRGRGFVVVVRLCRVHIVGVDLKEGSARLSEPIVQGDAMVYVAKMSLDIAVNLETLSTSFMSRLITLRP